MTENFLFDKSPNGTEYGEDDFCAKEVQYDDVQNTASFVSYDGERCTLDIGDLYFMKYRPFRQVDAYAKLDRNTQAWIRNRCKHLYTADGLEPFFGADEIRDEDIRTIFAFVCDRMSSLRSSFIAFLIDGASLISEKKCKEIMKELLVLNCFPQAWQLPMAAVRPEGDEYEDCFVTQRLPQALSGQVSEEEMRLLCQYAVLYLSDREREKVFLDALEKSSYGEALRFFDSFVREGLLPVEIGEEIVCCGIADAFDETDEIREGLRFLKQKGYTDEDLRQINPLRLRFLNIHNVERIWRMMSEALGKTDEELKDFFVHSGWGFEDPVYRKEPFEILKANGITDETIGGLFENSEIQAVSSMNPDTLRKVMKKLRELAEDEKELNHYILDNLEFLAGLPEVWKPDFADEIDDYYGFWKADAYEE